MSHGRVCLLDSMLREGWYFQPRFALSNALHKAFRLRAKRKIVRKSAICHE